MTERRKVQRRSISYYLRIIDSGANQMIGHLADISLQGLRMDSQTTLPVKKEYRLRINTTADVADKDYIEFVACTRWCQPDPLQTGLFEIGFEIMKIAPHDSEIIQRIVDKYSSRGNSFNI
jgi:c-di-GMP-binding flagellar brake protein YcgR